MASLHKKFLNQPGATDVITFQHGEIFVSVPTAQRQARQFETSLREEIQLYIVHGLLHLLGFDDRTRAGARRMRAAESAVLARSGV
jgi:probable rRNA maturation factor